MSCTYNCLMNVINIGNSIIGVSILAMPYCFSKCGILLSIILIIVSGLLTKLACYLLLKSAVMARRRSFEFLAFHTFGSYGKLIVEMSVIGFLIGVCIAFFVVIGDLGPPLAAEFLNIKKGVNIRTNVLILVGLCVALPLGMLRKIDSLTSLSALSIGFYVCLVLKIFAEAVPNLAENEWFHNVNWWRSEGILPCLPIFSMALSCQTQLFEFFDTTNDPSIKRMQTVIDGAVYLCSIVYMMVGTFGYIAFHDKHITGNILVLLTPSMVTEVIKLGFLLTVAVSFPLCLFPCRSSLHSLLFKQGYVHHDLNVNIIPDHRFRIMTVTLVVVTIGIAIMLPNIEFVLGIIGSTIGTLICLILPAMIFINDSDKMTSERRKAQILFAIGTFILIACTISTLQENGNRPETVVKQIPILQKTTSEAPLIVLSSISSDIQSPKDILKETPIIAIDKKIQIPESNVPSDQQKRLEPPIPQEPDVKVEPPVPQEPDIKVQPPIPQEQAVKVDQNGGIDPQALQKEDKELQKEVISNSVGTPKKEDTLEKQEILLKKLEQRQEEQKLILEESKKVLLELKQHKESHGLLEKQPVEKNIENPSSNFENQETKLGPLSKQNDREENLKLNKVAGELLVKQDEIIPKKENVVIPQKIDTPLLVDNNEISAGNIVKLSESKIGAQSNISVNNVSNQKLIKNQEVVLQKNIKDTKVAENVITDTKLEEFKQINKTLKDIASKILPVNKNLSIDAPKKVPKVLNIPLTIDKNAVKTKPEIIDPELIVKHRDTLANKIDFENTVSLPNQDMKLNVVPHSNKDVI